MALQAAIYAKAYFVSFIRVLCVTQPCDMLDDTTKVMMFCISPHRHQLCRLIW